MNDSHFLDGERVPAEDEELVMEDEEEDDIRFIAFTLFLSCLIVTLISFEELRAVCTAISIHLICFHTHSVFYNNTKLLY